MEKLFHAHTGTSRGCYKLLFMSHKTLNYQVRVERVVTSEHCNLTLSLKKTFNTFYFNLYLVKLFYPICFLKKRYKILIFLRRNHMKASIMYLNLKWIICSKSISEQHWFLLVFNLFTTDNIKSYAFPCFFPYFHSN